MKFEVVVETFGSKSQPYSNNPTTDVECILGKIKEFKSTGSQRHVVFVGEGHNNTYDKGRRARLIAEVHNNGQKHFPDGPPKVVSERFDDVDSGHVHLKEPKLADDLPKEFRALRKPNIVGDDDRATGVLSEQEKMLKLSGPGSQSRNQWFAYAIMETIKDTWSKPVPVVVVCGDDHAPFVEAAMADLTKGPYQSSAEVVWHHFPSAPDTVQPMNQVQASFAFDLQGKTPAGFIPGQPTHAQLLKLADGNIQKNFQVRLISPDNFGAGWALFYDDDRRAAQVRQMVLDGYGMPLEFTITTTHPVRVRKITREEIPQEWHEAFEPA